MVLNLGHIWFMYVHCLSDSQRQTYHTLLFSVQANEDELQARHSHLTDVLKVGDDLIQADNFGKEKIQDRTDEINGQWANLTELSNYRRKRLAEAVDFYQVGNALLLQLRIVVLNYQE